jgi:hypothetical protein
MEAATETRETKPAKNWIDPVREAKAVKALRESLAAVDGEDDALLVDTIEGETQLFEIIDKLLLRMAETRALIIGTEAVEGELYERRQRFVKRLDSDRALIEQALMIAELEKVERPAATLSMSKRQPSLQVITEADIPADYWKAGEPKLDKKALAAALKDGATVPGACLSNAAPTLTVRTR